MLNDVRRWVRPLSEVKEDYNFLMGYHIGKKQEWYRGIEGIYFIFNGEWSDPEIGYKGYAFNETYLDFMWDYYNEECEEKGIEADIDEGYTQYLQDNRWQIFEFLDGLIEDYKAAA